MEEQNIELRNIIEAAIFVADEPISIVQLLSLFPKEARPEKEEIITVVEQLMSSCDRRGIELKQVSKGFRFQSKEKYASWLRKLYEQKPPRYSRAVLETLSIIAYNQPVTRGDIEEIRGVSVSTEIMRTLLSREWVKEVGFKDVPGRPALYATTKVFLAYFNLNSIRELPVLQDKRELEQIALDNQIQLPPEMDESLQDTDAPDSQDSYVDELDDSQIKSESVGLSHDVSNS